MKAEYNKYYKKEDYFGRSYAELVDFFRKYKPKGHVLDLGCGQGRDSLMLGKLGYRVTGVDISSVGIRQMNDKAAKLKVDVTGIVSDIYTFPITDDYDFILMDSMLHFYKRDIEKESKLVYKVLEEMRAGAIFCNCMQKGAKREKIYKSLISNSKSQFKTIIDIDAVYPDFDALYNIYVVRKIID